MPSQTSVEPAPGVPDVPRATGSLWEATLAGDLRWPGGSPLAADVQADVAIVGAGYTGLWTAWHLIRRRPDARIVVLDKHHVGFGASGRNGGWCSALLPMSLTAIAARHGSSAATRMQRAMYDNVADVVAFAADHGLGDACHRGGTITVARTAAQLGRIDDELEELRRFGVDAGVERLGAQEADAICRATGVRGGMLTAHCATIHPLRLVHTLAAACSAAGVRIHEHTTVTSIEPRRTLGAPGGASVITDHGTVSADVVVRATEAFTVELPHQRRSLLPIYSLMIATEPLPTEVWDEIGLENRPTFNDGRNMIVYGQRTADARLAFGGRGARYHFGSAISPEFDTNPRIAASLTGALRELFPVLADVAITHHWGGAVAAPRDWHCSVRYDRTTGLAAGGGYVGDGVGTSHLAGRTLAALIAGDRDDGDDADRELTSLPWVAHRSRPWEPEPLRWLGVNLVRTAAHRADVAEQRRDRPSRLWSAILHGVLRHG